VTVKNGQPSEDLAHGTAPQVDIDFDAIAGDMPMDDKPARQAAAPAEPPAASEELPAEGSEVPPEQGGKAPTWMDKRFGDLAKQSAEVRKQREELKPVVALSRALSPVQASALEKALAAGNPMAAMTAMGFSYADVAASVAGGGTNPPVPPKKGEPPEEPEATSADPELEEIKRERREMRQQAQRSGIVQSIKTQLAPLAAKFKHINALENFDGVMGILDEFFEQAGSLPSQHAVENIRIAAEELERRYVDGELPLTRKQWEKIQGLTTQPSSASTQPEATRTRPGTAPGQRGSRTLTNNAGAPPTAPAANPTDPSKVISDLASDPNMPWS
jgi:hypothetical protein